MILLTGAAGKTGRAILNSLVNRRQAVRVFVRSAEQAAGLIQSGAREFFVGDLRDPATANQALAGIEKVYFICPNVSIDELEIGTTWLAAARQQKIAHFVYHSVLHPQVEAMPHHWQKMHLEEKIFESGLDFTILQPCAYMQNILGSWPAIQIQGIYPVPYRTSARISMVDLTDIAEAAAKVLSETGHQNAIYELAGPHPLSQDEVAETLGKVLGRQVLASEIDRKEWCQKALAGGMGEYAVSTLCRMFEYYDQYGFVGNSRILESLIQREASSLITFLSLTTLT